MQFNKNVIGIKVSEIENAEKNQLLIMAVLSNYFNEPSFELNKIVQAWFPGGGSILYKVIVNNVSYKIKMKSLNLLIESKLEGESAFSDTPSIRNEFEFMKSMNHPSIAHCIHYEENNGFGFLITPFFENMLSDVLYDLDFITAYKILNKTKAAIRYLYDNNIIHTDIHEENIAIENLNPIIIDFEEAKKLIQIELFEDSLDVLGETKQGNVGNMPNITGFSPGLTCLNRIEKIFKDHYFPMLETLIKSTVWDETSPYNLDVLQEPDSRIYQSINIDDISIQGQRPILDAREDLILKLSLEFTHDFRALDIGCNLGNFVFNQLKINHCVESVGIEVDQRYFDAAEALKYYLNHERAKFYKLYCGQDKLVDYFSKPFDIITILSVYHHIPIKDLFLNDLKHICSCYCVIEFATQQRYYIERGGYLEEIEYIKNHSGFKTVEKIAVSDDYKRPIYLFRKY
jgi:2-polyprenyl-3-methyl-5-hydroxy-6-metoxy-1,4-benzoquinol methylase